jgi:hypothetical protein
MPSHKLRCPFPAPSSTHCPPGEELVVGRRHAQDSCHPGRWLVRITREHPVSDDTFVTAKRQPWLLSSRNSSPALLARISGGLRSRSGSRRGHSAGASSRHNLRLGGARVARPQRHACTADPDIRYWWHIVIRLRTRTSSKCRSVSSCRMIVKMSGESLGWEHSPLYRDSWLLHRLHIKAHTLPPPAFDAFGGN